VKQLTDNDISDLQGCMVDGYTPEDIDRVFGRLENAFGVRLVCVWDYFDAFGYGGNSQFYVVGDDGRLHESAGDLYTWLNFDPAADEAPDSPGPPDSWRGAPADLAEPEGDDGFYNVALENRD
jgi:hypothetical protein